MHPMHVAKPLHEQLRRAWEDSDLTLEQIRDRLSPDARESIGTIPSLSRKLNGKQIMTTTEAEALARVLKLKIGTGNERRAS